MKYIDVDLLLKEIEKKSHEEQGFSSEDSEYGYRSCARDLLAFISSLQQEQPDFPSNLEEAAEEYANKEYPDEPCVGQWGTGDYEPPVDNEYPREIAKDAFKSGAKWMENQFEHCGTFPIEDSRGGYWPTDYYIKKK